MEWCITYNEVKTKICLNTIEQLRMVEYMTGVMRNISFKNNESCLGENNFPWREFWELSH